MSRLSSEEVLRVYCGMVYEQVGRQYEAAAKIIGKCGRKVRRYVDSHATTKQYSSHSGPPRKPK